MMVLLLLVSISIWCLRDKPETHHHLPPRITLYISKNDQILSLSLEEYICGTVAAEMPASFEDEALKAQAICARTYALNRMINGIKYAKNADMSDDITCCQAYVTDQEFGKRHPAGTEEYLEKIQQAVEETRGQVMLYKGEPLDALYSSTCGGRTEEGGARQPYLKGIVCPYCQSSPRYLTRQTFTGAQLNRLLGLTGRDIRIKVTKRSLSGRIKQIKVNEQIMSGEKLRTALGLPSTRCTFLVDGNRVDVISRGYGHGIGLCQFGANGMAKQGKSYRQILQHYYQDFELCQMQY